MKDKRQYWIIPVFSVAVFLLYAGCGADVEELEAELLYGSRNQRLEAARELSERGIVEILVLGLQDTDEAVRRRVVEELRSQGEAAVGSVLELMQRRPNNVELLAAGVEVLEAAGNAAREGVVESGLSGGPREVDLAYRVLRKLPDSGADLDRLLADDQRTAWLLQSGDPAVRLELLDRLAADDKAELEALLKAFSNDTVDLYTLAPQLESVPDPLPGEAGFGPPGAGLELLNNLTALELELLLHRRELRQLIQVPPELAADDYYETVPWSVFNDNFEAGVRRCLESSEAVENLPPVEVARLCRHLSRTYSLTAEAYPDNAGSRRLLAEAALFAELADELERPAGEGG